MLWLLLTNKALFSTKAAINSAKYLKPQRFILIFILLLWGRGCSYHGTRVKAEDSPWTQSQESALGEQASTTSTSSTQNFKGPNLYP